jgi:hypothetical protein
MVSRDLSKIIQPFGSIQIDQPAPDDLLDIRVLLGALAGENLRRFPVPKRADYVLNVCRSEAYLVFGATRD